MKYKILSFIIALVIALQSFGPLTVYASSKGGGGVSRPASKTDTTGFNDWSTSDKFKWYSENIISVIGGVVGCIFVPSNWNYDHFMSTLQSMVVDKGIANDSADFEEYLAKRLSKNDDGDIVVQDDLADLMYQATNVYIEEYTGFYIGYSVDYNSLNASFFSTKEDYDNFKKICNYWMKENNNAVYFYDSDVGFSDSKAYLLGHYFNISKWDLVGSPKDEFTYNVYFYDKNWVNYNLARYKLFEDGTKIEKVDGWSPGYECLSVGHLSTYVQGGTLYYFLTDGARAFRIYKTEADLKSYSVGQRPYYVTSQYTNYNTGDDNTCTISDSQLENSSVYGDVYNYITNNYDNPDALTEDELRQILDEYFGRYNPPSGTDYPSGGGSGSGSSGGSGLSDFLSGLGSLGDGILSILGKLLEYIGKAVDLLSGTVTKIIDVIPNNITNLIGALFPFIPEEWLVAVELSLVLAVIAGVIKIFKG